MHRRVVRYFNLKNATGVQAISVSPGSPAEIAGLREGDVMVEFEGNPVPSIDALHKMLTAERIGQRSTLAVVRGAEKIELSVTPTESV
jgi:S1-C subfamily serine protease